ncbi:DUF3810 family protein [Reinekea sp.]|jgi:hypothetical protein|uniref:DUF3810 family protein n=1 Tax=Reinekea sp. TaxID=1970455 RepID=UPI002A82F320|nr:DUF3810 family protein [Reinekea sp.]
MRWRLIVATCCIALSIGLTRWPTAGQDILDRLYGLRLYPWLQQGLQLLPEPSGFALMDLLWLLLPLLFLARLVWLLRTNLMVRLPRVGTEILLWCSIAYLLLMLLWGLNYHRPALYQQLQQEGLSAQLNTEHWHFALQESTAMAARLPVDFDVCAQAPVTFNAARPGALLHSTLAGRQLTPPPQRNVRASAWSWLYVRLGIAGLYSPLTGEPTYSQGLFPWSKPFVMTHEYSHWAGFAREYDADILAYWALWASPDPIWQYSAWLEWWMAIGPPAPVVDALPATLQTGMACYAHYLKQQPRWSIGRLLWHAYELNLKNQGVPEGLASYQMGEAMALAGFYRARVSGLQ